jgi:predicted nucleic acid-binding protein
MKLYLDVCCLNRPFDDQSQQRIRVETEAIGIVLDLCVHGPHRWLISDALEDEVLRNPDPEPRAKVLDTLQLAQARLTANKRTFQLAGRYQREQTLAAMDALHLALAELGGCDILLTTDDDFVRRADRLRPRLHVRVKNPVTWLMETARTW